jgi:hypothetical protein
MKLALLAAGLSAVLLPNPLPTPAPTTYFGVYAASVTANADPLQAARLQIEVPAVPDANGLWAQVSAPYANGAMPEVPPLGATVWVMFQQGNPEYPVWIGWRPQP